jgi:hypothetical protein
MQELKYQYTTQRYGTVSTYRGELYRDGYIYHGVDNRGDEHWVDNSAHVLRIPIDAVPPAPFAPADMTDVEARLLHFLEWGRRAWLANATPEVVARETEWSSQYAREMAAGGVMEKHERKSIWWRFVVEHLDLTPERI